MVYQKPTHAGLLEKKQDQRSSVLTPTVNESLLENERNNGKVVPLYMTEWNVHTLMNRTASQCPGRQTALVAMELN